MYFEALAKKYRFSLHTPVRELPPQVLDVILYGTNGEKLTLYYDQERGQGTLHQPFEGIVNNLERRYRETQSDAVRRELEEFMSENPCPACGGRRLKKESLAVTVGGLNIDEFSRKSVLEALEFIGQLSLTGKDAMIADRILKEIRERLGFLRSVGLQYLTLSRQAGSLSGGESQRIRRPPKSVPLSWACFTFWTSPHRPSPAGQQDAARYAKALRDWATPARRGTRRGNHARRRLIVDVGPRRHSRGRNRGRGTPEEIMRELRP
jgi:hypothetical protein